jgi:hypothetical protein
MIKATLVFGLYSDTYQKTEYGWNTSISKNLWSDATKVLSDVIAENYPNADFYVEWVSGDTDLKNFTPDGKPLTRYTVTMFIPNADTTWSMKNVKFVEKQLNETFRNKFIYAFGEVDLDYPDGVWCNNCTAINKKDCKVCKGEKIITYESMLND